MTGSISQAICTSFLVELLKGTHNFTNSTGDVFKIVLLKGTVAGIYSSATTNYSDVTGNSDEVPNGSGYTTGGIPLTNFTPINGGTTAYTNFTTVTWPSSTISSSGALIYNSSKSNRAVAVLAFGSIISSSATTFTVNFPVTDQNNSIIRLNAS